MTVDRVDTLVVGAGPAGLFAALKLAEAGRQIRIIDAGQPTARENYALALHPQTLVLLDKSGVLGSLELIGRKLYRSLYLESGAIRTTVSYERLTDQTPYLLILPQTNLEEALLDRLEELGVKVEWNSAIYAMDRRDDGITARIALLDPRGGFTPAYTIASLEKDFQTIETRFLVGCDGARSTVRRLMGIPMNVHGRVRHFLLYEMELEEVLRDELRIELNPQGTGMLWPMPDRRCRWTFEMPVPPQPSLSAGDLLGLLQDRAPWFYVAPRTAHWFTRLSTVTALAKSFAAPWVRLAGDAVHQHSPFGVQGMNSGLQEAVLAARSIIESLDGKDEGDLVAAYNAGLRTIWEETLGLGHQTSNGLGHPWIESHARIIRETLPATGRPLNELMSGMKVEEDDEFVSDRFFPKGA